jgi:hypothetical protein
VQLRNDVRRDVYVGLGLLILKEMSRSELELWKMTISAFLGLNAISHHLMTICHVIGGQTGDIYNFSNFVSIRAIISKGCIVCK